MSMSTPQQATASPLKTLADRLQPVWEKDMIAVVGTLESGPQAGELVVCTTPRENFIQMMLALATSGQVNSRTFVDGIKASIERQVMKGPTSAGPDFSRYILVLHAINCLLAERVVDGSGLFDLTIAISTDSTKPWHARGFLNVEGAASFDKANSVGDIGQ